MRSEPLLLKGKKGKCSKGCIGETAGECAAVCCCCPCGVMHLLILAVYRIPAGIWQRRRRRKRNRVWEGKEGQYGMRNWSKGTVVEEEGEEEEKRVVEEEVWGEGFYRGGFWRSNSESDSRAIDE